VHQKSRGTIPLVTDAGADTNIPLAIRPKGNSYLQLGPNTYGVSGWSGSDVEIEMLNLSTATSSSYGYYTELTAGDFNNGSVIGNSISVYSKDTATNNTDQLIGLDANAFPQLPSGKTMRQAVGAQAQVESFNAGIISSAFGIQGFVTARDDSHIPYAVAVNGASSADENGVIDVAFNHQSVFGKLSSTSGAGAGIDFLATHVYTLDAVPMGAHYVLYSTNSVGTAINGFFLWNDSPGVYTVKDDGTTGYYNPLFSPKYTIGSEHYERAVQQWNSNVLEYGTQAGGYGTLRGVKILGASLQTPDLTAPTLKVTPGLEPSSPTEGMIYANSSDHHLYFYNGTTWKQLDN
jgi:hypothetical protein